MSKSLKAEINYEENNKYSARNTGLDCLRILMMLWIILRHLSNVAYNHMIIAEGNIFNWLFGIFSFMGGDIANVVFILISGYLMSTRPFHFEKWIRIWLELLFYSIFSNMIAMLLHYESLSVSAILKMIMPIRTNTYWFASTYLILFFMFPVYNFIIQQSPPKLLIYLMGTGVLLFTFLPIFYNILNVTNSYLGFSLLYIMGG